MIIKKLEQVINSCKSNKQLMVAKLYAELFLEKYAKHYNLTRVEETQLLRHTSKLLTIRSKEVCVKAQAINFNIYLNRSNRLKTKYYKRYFSVLENYCHLAVEDRIKREEYSWMI